MSKAYGPSLGAQRKVVRRRNGVQHERRVGPEEPRGEIETMMTPQRMQSPAPFGTGVLLGEEEHDQESDETRNLLIAQLHFDCQLEHGNSLVCAGRPANLLKVGFDGYEEPAALAGRWDSWPSNGGVSITTGNYPRSRALTGGEAEDFQFLVPNVELTGAPLARPVERKVRGGYQNE